MEPGIALFGGVFDPPHHGHLALARAAAEALEVETVRFLIAGTPPHKDAESATPAAARLAMLELAVFGAPNFTIDRRELDRIGPSYTVLTLEEIRAESPNRPIYFLIGGDNIRSIGRWYQAERLFDLATVIAMPRPGEPTEFRAEDVPFLSPEERLALNAATLPAIDFPISSTAIRERVAAGGSISDQVPPAVEAYIRETGLYR